MKHKRVIYIAGPIAGVAEYYKAFEAAEEKVEGYGYTALSPSRLPKGMTNAQYMQICIGMINSADEVLFLDGWEMSGGASLEHSYCEYIGKRIVTLSVLELRDKACKAFLEKMREVWGG